MTLEQRVERLERDQAQLLDLLERAMQVLASLTREVLGRRLDSGERGQ